MTDPTSHDPVGAAGAATPSRTRSSGLFPPGRSRAGSVIDLEQPLLDLAESARQAVRGSDGAGVTLIEDDGSPLYRSSNDFARAVDRTQYRLGEGPCVDAVLQARTVVSGTVGVGERRWPRFDASARSLRVHSVLSIPLVVADQVIGSVNLYARDRDVFDADAIEVGEEFARPAAATLSTAQLLVDTIEVADLAAYALADRATVETAVGVLIGLHHLSPSAARRRLTSLAEAAGTPLKTAAERVLADLARPPRAGS